MGSNTIDTIQPIHEGGLGDPQFLSDAGKRSPLNPKLDETLHGVCVMHSFDSFLILVWCRRHFCRLGHYEGGDEFPGVTGRRHRWRRLQTGATTRCDTQPATRSNTQFLLKKELTRFGRDNDLPRQRGSSSRSAPFPQPPGAGATLAEGFQEGFPILIVLVCRVVELPGLPPCPQDW
jgi:hypothetical protein